ncbi:MAG TPA: biotin--[acetyl-CoA-carboxylase] ligase [Acidimicrobiales bacterium]|nr:biotin--[acetyl-CoA-carboxylase] ligase [Acidimicrobiales bacterium]
MAQERSGDGSHPRFSDVRWFAQVDSTNRLAAELVRGGAGDGLVVGADHQTGGRGRRGRTWESRPGSSLMVSVVLRPVPDLVTLAAGLAAAEACEAVAGVPVHLKWPNDVMGAGGKLGGILSELVGDAAVVGLGLNLAWAPPGAVKLGADVDRQVLLHAWLSRLDAPADVLVRYRARCATLGRRVRVELPGETLEGVADAVDEEGRLVVGGRHVTAGDVVHLR